MILNQDKQAKLHEELDSVVGEERMIRAAERTQLPYLMATINVNFNCAQIVYFFICRKSNVLQTWFHSIFPGS